MGEIVVIGCLVATVVGLLLFLWQIYRLYKNHTRDMRRLARQCNRAIRDNNAAIEDICLESMRRDGYMFRRGSK